MALLCAAVVSLAQGGTPYVTEQYQVSLQRDLPVGTAIGYDGATVSLSVNVALPVDDGSSLRPLLIWVHGGGFFDGNRGQMDALIERWARRGYVAASPSYRLSFHGGLIGPPFAYDEAELVRACYRAVQDVWGSVRYLVKNAAAYRIDTSRIVLAGVSAGAITVLHMGMVDGADKAPAEAGAIADAVRYGTAYKRPDLGPIAGTLHTDVPTPSVRAIVNVMGGLLKLDYLQGSPIPALYSYHQADDPIVPCETKRCYHGAPLNIAATNPVISGSCAITTELQRSNVLPSRYRSWIWQGADHDVHDAIAVDLDAAQFVAGVISQPVSVAEERTATEMSFPADVVTMRGEVIVRATSREDLEGLADGVYAVVQQSHAVLCIKVGVNLLMHQ